MKQRPRVIGFEFQPSFGIAFRFNSCVSIYDIDYKHLIQIENFLDLQKNEPPFLYLRQSLRLAFFIVAPALKKDEWS